MENNEIVLHPSQWKIHIVNANVTYCPWARSAGKTTGGIGPRYNHLRKAMPRSQSILFSDTYERIHDKLVPNIELFLQEKLKLQDGRDYVSFRKPPDHWQKPLIPIKKYDHVISFADGFAVCCVSASVEGSANSFNAQSAIIDEAKFIKEEKINTELLPALRGAKELFGHLPEYLSHWYFTDKWGENISWLLAKKNRCDQKLIQAVLSLEIKIQQWQLDAFSYSSSATQYKYLNKVNAYRKKLDAIKKDLVYYCESKPYENEPAVGKKYFRDKRRDLSELEYNVAILNLDPDTVVNTFYPALARVRHYHKIMTDTNEQQPLIAAMDYQWRITPMVVGQYGTLPGSIDQTFNIVNSIHTLHPQGGIKATVNAFCEYYKARNDKSVYYVYDHTATAKHSDSDSFKDIAVKAWLANDWNVIDIHMGQAPLHHTKHETIKKLMLLNKIMFNDIRAYYLLESMRNAGAITTGGITKKDKSKEKTAKNPVEQTDYSDAFDTLAIGVVEMNLVSSYKSSFADISM